MFIYFFYSLNHLINGQLKKRIKNKVKKACCLGEKSSIFATAKPGRQGAEPVKRFRKVHCNNSRF